MQQASAQGCNGCFNLPNSIPNGSFQNSCNSGGQTFLSDLSRCDSLTYDTLTGYYYIHNDPVSIYRDSFGVGTDHTVGAGTNFLIAAVKSNVQGIKTWSEKVYLDNSKTYCFSGHFMNTSSDTNHASALIKLRIYNAAEMHCTDSLQLLNGIGWMSMGTQFSPLTSDSFWVEILVASQFSGWHYIGVDDIQLNALNTGVSNPVLTVLDSTQTGSLLFGINSGFAQKYWMFFNGVRDSIIHTSSDTIRLLEAYCQGKVICHVVDNSGCTFSSNYYAKTAQDLCNNNLNFEFGNLNNWTGDFGVASSMTYNWGFPSTGLNNASIATGSQIDGNTLTPTTFPQQPLFLRTNTVIPLFGNNAVRVGSPALIGNQGQEIRFSYQVPTQSPILKVAFAIVSQAALPNQRAFRNFVLFVVDANGGIVNPACLNYGGGTNNTATDFIPGTVGSGYNYTPWEQYLLDLTSVAGQTVTIVAAARSEVQVGQSLNTYAYLDFACTNLEPIAVDPYCSGCGPVVNAIIGYTNYDWGPISNIFLNQSGFPNVYFNPSIPPGSYQLRVASSGNIGIGACNLFIPFTIPPPVQLTASSTIQNITCNGGNNGSISVLPVGGYAPYTYTWTPALPNSPIQTFLTAGTYYLTITDNTCCSYSTQFTLTEPNPIQVQVSTSPESCSGSNDGFAQVVSTVGGTGPYTYKWNTIPPQSGTSIGNLAAGNYILTVEDNLGCSQTFPVTINVAPPPAAVNLGPDLKICQYTGMAYAPITIGTAASAGYSYSWNTTPIQTTAQASVSNIVGNLPKGDCYERTITDLSNNCEWVDEICLIPVYPPNIDLTAELDCGTTCVRFQADVDDSSPNYIFNWTWDNSNGTQTTTNTNSYSFDAVQDCNYSGSGSYPYEVTVTNGFGCVATASGTINLNLFNAIPSNFAGDDKLYCPMVPNTFVDHELGLLGGLSTVWPFVQSVSWTGPNQFTSNLENPIIQVYEMNNPSGAGYYIIEVTDSNGCVYKDQVLITRCCFDGYYPLNTVVITGGGTLDVNTIPPNTANLYLDGQFTVIGNVSIGVPLPTGSNRQINMGPFSSIEVVYPNSLAIYQHRINACDIMWNGFITDAPAGIPPSGGRNLTLEDDEIEDALIAIETRNEGSFSLNTCQFIDNYIGIRINPFRALHNNNLFNGEIYNVEFKTHLSTIMTVPPGLLFPYQGFRAHKGIEIIGNLNQAPNATVTLDPRVFQQTAFLKFRDMDQGIHALEVNLNVRNSEFSSIDFPHAFSNPLSFGGGNYAVYASGQFSNSILGIRLENNQVSNGGHGFFIRNFREVKAFDNQMNLNARPTSTGIWFRACGRNNGNILVHENRIQNSVWGVRGAMNQNTAKIQVYDNDINLMGVSNSTGIDIFRGILTPNQVRVRNNIIQAEFAGISCAGSGAPALPGAYSILQNLIYMGFNPGQFGIGRDNWGIGNSAWPGARIHQNEIHGQYISNRLWKLHNKTRGIEIGISPMNEVTCNSINVCAFSFVSQQNCNSSRIRNNNFTTAHRGLTLMNNGLISQQGQPGDPTDNKFSGPFTLSDLFSKNTNIASLNSRMFGRNAGLYLPAVSVSDPISNLPICFSPRKVCYVAFSVSQPAVDCLPNFSNGIPNSAELEPAGTSPDFNWMHAVAADTLAYEWFATSTTWLNKLMLYRQLEFWVSERQADSVLENYYQNVRHTDAGKVNEIEANFRTEDFEVAQDLLDVWMPQDTIALGYKSFYEFMTRQNGEIPETLSEEDSTLLWTLASQCPAKGGEVVLWARKWVSFYLDTLMQNECEFLENPPYTEQDSIDDLELSGDIVLYPNPASTSITIQLPEAVEDDSEIMIHDMMGILKLSSAITAYELSKVVNVESLAQGLFVVSVTRNGILQKSINLLILRN
jgi:hypothetical protein